MVRSGHRLWIERVLPSSSRGSARAGAHGYAGSSRGHRHAPDWGRAARLLTRRGDEAPALELVLDGGELIVTVPPGELDSVGVDASWAELAHLYPPMALAALRRVRGGDEAVEVYEGGEQTARVRVEWDAQRQLARRVDVEGADGTLRRRVEASLEPCALPLPWQRQRLVGAERRSLDDFRD